MSLVNLLCDEEDKKNTIFTTNHVNEEQIILDHIDNSSVATKKN